MKLRVIVVLVVSFIGLEHAKVLNLSCGQIRRFVDGHNSRRLKLAKGLVEGQPAAAEMKMMVWDEELATKAAGWAKRDKFEHNPDKTIGSHRFTCGENLYWYSTTDHDYVLDPDKALQEWFDEHRYFTHKLLSWDDFETDPEHQIGHYTQMAWANSTYVGCAISQYIDEKDWKNFYVVCNYGPQGNWIGEPPYKSGRASRKITCGGSQCKKKYGNSC